MILSDRLEAILAQLSLYAGCECLADVGCDHGFTSIEAVKRGYVRHAIAMDLREGPLSRAALHIRECPHPEAVETRLSDGLDRLEPGEADVILISGMGGDLIQTILERGSDAVRAASLLILQPQKDVTKLRRYLDRDFCLLSEDLVCEDGKYYFIITGKPCPGYVADYTDAECAFGRRLLQMRHPVLKEYLRSTRQKQQDILRRIQSASGVSQRRAQEMERQIAATEEALALYQKDTELNF